MPNVLISGASIAGPTLAYWLVRRGFQVTVVERAPALREGGHGVDFRGAQMELLERMNLADEVRRHQTGLGDQYVVDEHGRRLVTLPGWFASGEVEIERGDLSRILYDSTRHDVEYVFGDWITALHDTSDGVDVTFAHAAPRRYDLVVGADGMYSGVRALAFGPISRFARFLGYYQAGYTMPNVLGLDRSGLIYNEPGRAVLVSSGRDRNRASVGLVFASPLLRYDRHDTDALKDLIRQRYSGARWKTPQLLDGMRTATDVFFSPLQQIRMPRWSTGRVVLLGDAAWAAGPGGSGTGLAMMGAYVLAGELGTCGGDYSAAFARYESALRKAATTGQRQAKGAGPFLAPPTAAKIRRRNWTYRALTSRPLSGLFARLAAGAANAVTLPDYPTPPVTAWRAPATPIS